MMPKKKRQDPKLEARIKEAGQAITEDFAVHDKFDLLEANRRFSELKRLVKSHEGEPAKSIIRAIDNLVEQNYHNPLSAEEGAVNTTPKRQTPHLNHMLNEQYDHGDDNQQPPTVVEATEKQIEAANALPPRQRVSDPAQLKPKKQYNPSLFLEKIKNMFNKMIEKFSTSKPPPQFDNPLFGQEDSKSVNSADFDGRSPKDSFSGPNREGLKSSSSIKKPSNVLGPSDSSAPQGDKNNDKPAPDPDPDSPNS